MTNQPEYVGRISARTISAKNVVAGLQARGSTDPSIILALAKQVRSGSIDADQLTADNIVSGTQIDETSSDGSLGDLLADVRSLREALEKLDTTDVEVLNADEHADATTAITALERELEKPEPQGRRVTRLISGASDILESGASAAEKAGKLTTTLSGVVMQAAALWQSIHHLFG